MAGNAGSSYQAISTSGQIVYFTACPSNIEGGVNEIYARVDATSTITISSPSPSQCVTCNQTPASAAFEGASPDGSEAFFMTSQPLVSGDEKGTGTGNDLYEYDFDNSPGENLVQLSAGGAGDLTPGSGAEVQGVVRTSSDGSHVYFVARGVLTTVPDLSLPSGHQVAEAGADNLYVVDTATGHTSFIADLCSNASFSGAAGDSQCPATLNDKTSGANDGALWGPDGGRQAQTTPDGRYLVFTTYARLITAGGEADTDEAQDVYRYDFQTGRLIRVSIGEPSFPASHNANTPSMNATVAPLPRDGALASINDFNRALSDEGSTIVFATPEALQADDIDMGSNPSCSKGTGSTGCDVYVWHECASGTCEDDMAGEVHMISPGDDTTDEETKAGLAAMSESGSDIFFFTQKELVGQDVDQLVDVYDARIGGGFPVPVPKTSCSGEACQGTPSRLPTFSSPGSSSFTDGGNLTAPPATLSAPIEPRPKTKLLTKAQKLAKALKVCKQDKSKKKRATCVRHARKEFGPSKKKKK